MVDNRDIVLMVTDSVKASAPDATVILYGSRARGDNNADSDFDLLILLDKDRITREDEKGLNIHYMISNSKQVQLLVL